MEIKSICIVGGGTAGWMTAAALSFKLQNSPAKIYLVESEQIGTVGVGEATLPHIRYFNNALGIDEAAFMKATNATFKLGIEFCDWGRIGDSYIHPFGDFGQPLNNVEFYQYWNKLRLNGETTRLDEYSYPVMLAEKNKFHIPDTDIRKIESTFGYAYQFDSSKYAKFLRKFAEAKGVTRIEGRITHSEKNNPTGHISSVTLESGQSIEAELFIDCSGFRGLLIEQAYETGYDDWSQWLPCNRAIAVASETTEPLPPYTRATARKAGWQWRIPLQHRTGNGIVYCSDYMSNDEAAQQLLTTLDGKALASPNQLYFKTGRRKKFWHKNIVAIGLSAGFLEPLESTSIHLIQEGITALLEVFPNQNFEESDAAEYNQRMGLQYERVRDFLLLHYVATTRDDSEFWNYFRNMILPDSLKAKIDNWLMRGHISRYDFGAFLPPSWVAVFIGQNLLPNHSDTRVDKMTLKDIQQRAGMMKKSIQNSVRQSPDHADFIRSQGAAIEPSVNGQPDMELKSFT